MKAETVSWGDLVLRKEAIIGIDMGTCKADAEQNRATITLYLISGQSINITSPLDKVEADYKRIKSMANLV